MSERLNAPAPSFLRDLLDEDRVTDPVWSRLPVSERVSDRLSDLLFGADEILGFLIDEHATSLEWLIPEVRRVYDDVARLMNKVTD